MKAFLSLFLLGTVCITSAQTEFSISGLVTTTTDKGLENVNVILLKEKDSSLVKGTITSQNGHYEFNSVVPGNYLLQFSKVGYKNIYKLYTASGETGRIKIETVVLSQEARSLKEVTITTRKPFIEQKLDRMIINIENSIISAGNNGLEVLEKLPGVSVNPTGEISLKGKGGVQVHIDGRPTNMSSDDLANFLRGLTANQIEKIEIISNPSSRYDAAGSAGIINIRIKKDQKIGLNGTATFGYTQGVYAKFNQGLSMNYRNKKLNLFGSYTINDRKAFTDMSSERKFKSGNTLLANFIQDGSATDHTTSYNLRTGIDFFVSKRSTLGFLITGFNNKISQQNNNQTFITGSTGQTDSMLFTFNNNKSKWNTYTVNTNFKHRIDSSGKEITFDLDYSNYDRRNEQFFLNIAANKSGTATRPADTLLGNLPALLKIVSFKTDYIHPLKNSNKVEAGIKSSCVSNDYDLAFYNQQGRGSVLNTSLSNHFIYQENINAVYINYAQERKKWNYQLGLRGEQTIAKGTQVTTSQKFTRNYFELFPTAFVNFTLSEKHQLGVSYSRRIGRPAYNIVNPFRIYRDQYTYSEGNPLIKPQLSNNLELNYVFNNIIIVSLDYGNTNSSMTFVVKQDDASKTTIETYDNLAKLQDGGLSVSSNFKIFPWWTANNFVGFFYNHFQGMFSNQLVDNSGVIFNASINHSISLPKNYTIEVGGFYLSNQPQGIITVAPQANLNIGVQKLFAQKRGTFRITFSDVFHTQQFKKITRFANVDAVFQNIFDSRQVRFGLTWKFGKQTVPSERRRKSASEDEKNRIQID